MYDDMIVIYDYDDDDDDDHGDDSERFDCRTVMIRMMRRWRWVER